MYLYHTISHAGLDLKFSFINFLSIKKENDWQSMLQYHFIFKVEKKDCRGTYMHIKYVMSTYIKYLALNDFKSTDVFIRQKKKKRTKIYL